MSVGICGKWPFCVEGDLTRLAGVVPNRRYSGLMARPPQDDDATKNLKPEDETQRAKAGTKIGKGRKGEVMADFKKIARAARR